MINLQNESSRERKKEREEGEKGLGRVQMAPKGDKIEKKAKN